MVPVIYRGPSRNNTLDPRRTADWTLDFHVPSLSGLFGNSGPRLLGWACLTPPYLGRCTLPFLVTRLLAKTPSHEQHFSLQSPTPIIIKIDHVAELITSDLGSLASARQFAFIYRPAPKYNKIRERVSAGLRSVELYVRCGLRPERDPLHIVPGIGDQWAFAARQDEAFGQQSC